MEITGDELAGVVDLFGGLTRDELDRALSELAFRAGEDGDADEFAAAVDGAIAGYRLVAVTVDGAEGDGDGDGSDGGETVLVPGPVAFPDLPEYANDLPHILDVERRRVDRSRVADRVVGRLRDEAAAAVADGDADRAATLREVTYDAEAWASVDLDGVRDRLADVTADPSETSPGS